MHFGINHYSIVSDFNILTNDTLVGLYNEIDMYKLNKRINQNNWTMKEEPLLKSCLFIWGFKALI